MILLEYSMGVPKVGGAGERRRRPRFHLACGLRVDLPGDVLLQTRTEDVSAESFFFFTDSALALGQIIECDLAIPRHRPRSAQEFHDIFSPDSNIVLRCRAEVVRISPQPDHVRFGVACRLRDYTVGARLDSIG